MRSSPLTVTATSLVFLSFNACATKGFVRTSIREVNAKVETVGKSLEATQERARANEGRITEVDQKVQSAERSAQQAAHQAEQANQAASDASKAATTANTKADTIDKENKKLLFQVALNHEADHFEFGSARLPDSAKHTLDELVSQLQQDPKNLFIEIEGYTDDIGSRAANQRVGLKRAEAVERYLHEQYQIPLHKMNVISYGEDNPVAPNKTKAGRAENRRIVVKVLS